MPPKMENYPVGIINVVFAALLVKNHSTQQVFMSLKTDPIVKNTITNSITLLVQPVVREWKVNVFNLKIRPYDIPVVLPVQYVPFQIQC